MRTPPVGEPSGAPRPYFGALDGIRGVAALLIVNRHLDSLVLYTGPESYLAVDVFFVLSGVVIASSYEARLGQGFSLRDFAVTRIVRLYPLYMFGTAIAVVATAFGHSMAPKQFAECIVFAALLLPFPRVTAYPFPLNPPAWSLFCELVVNILYAWLLRFLNTRVLAIIAIASAVAMVVLLAPNHARGLDVGVETATLPQGLLRSVYSFSVGVLIFRQFTAARGWTIKGAGANGATWIIIAVVGVILLGSPTLAARPLYDFVAVLLIFPALVWLAVRLEVNSTSSRIFKFFGVASYAVYSIHVPIKVAIDQIARVGLGPSARNAGPWAGIDRLSAFAPWIGFVFMASFVALAWVLDKYFDAPVRKAALKRLLSRR